MSKLTLQDIVGKKNSEKLSMVTCYDYSFARAIDGLVDMILVGDSLGNVVLGYDKTSQVTMNDMLRHVGAVARGAVNTFIVGDLPSGAYETAEEAVANARKLIKAGASAVKPEGKPYIIQALVNENIPVVGHLGLLPQTAESFSVIGRQEDEAERLLHDAGQVEQAGAFAVVFECVPARLAKQISQQLSIPVIGIGSGVDCDGQVLVLYDLLGLFPDFQAKFVRQYADLKKDVKKAIEQFTADVKKAQFPSDKESFK